MPRLHFCNILFHANFACEGLARFFPVENLVGCGRACSFRGAGRDGTGKKQSLCQKGRGQFPFMHIVFSFLLSAFFNEIGD
ncbi:hypothetical protein D1841_11430 [Neglecta sp. X4]|nr:hypothetical protein [Neglectibacter sp. X4]NCE80606.1 hypothetical protein [Neglectibacter sp. X58]